MPRFGLADQNKQRYTQPSIYENQPSEVGEEEEALMSELRDLEEKLVQKGRPRGGVEVTFFRSQSQRNDLGDEIPNAKCSQSHSPIKGERGGRFVNGGGSRPGGGGV